MDHLVLYPVALHQNMAGSLRLTVTLVGGIFIAANNVEQNIKTSLDDSVCVYPATVHENPANKCKIISRDGLVSERSWRIVSYHGLQQGWRTSCGESVVTVEAILRCGMDSKQPLL